MKKRRKKERRIGWKRMVSDFRVAPVSVGVLLSIGVHLNILFILFNCLWL